MMTKMLTSVAAISLNVTDEIVLTSRQPLLLTAIPLDQNSGAIHGLKTRWESSNKRVIFVRKNSEAVAGNPGEATITARAGGKSATVHVTVVEGTKEPFGGKKRVDSTRKSKEQALRQKSTGNSGVMQWMNPRRKQAHAIRKLAGLSSPMPFIRDPNDDPLPDNETSSLYDPKQLNRHTSG